MITEDEFDQWRDNEVTQAVFKAFDVLADRGLQEWITASWEHGNCDPLLRADIHARVQVIEDFRKIDFSILKEWLENARDEDPKLRVVKS